MEQLKGRKKGQKSVKANPYTKSTGQNNSEEADSVNEPVIERRVTRSQTRAIQEGIMPLPAPRIRQRQQQIEPQPGQAPPPPAIQRMQPIALDVVFEEVQSPSIRPPMLKGILKKNPVRTSILHDLDRGQRLPAGKKPSMTISIRRRRNAHLHSVPNPLKMIPNVIAGKPNKANALRAPWNPNHAMVNPFSQNMGPVNAETPPTTIIRLNVNFNVTAVAAKQLEANLVHVYPRLINRCEKIPGFVINQLTGSRSRNALIYILQSSGIYTIGSLCRRTHKDIITWPIFAPKLETLQNVLRIYENKEHGTTGENGLGKPKFCYNNCTKRIKFNGPDLYSLAPPVPPSASKRTVLQGTRSVNSIGRIVGSKQRKNENKMIREILVGIRRLTPDGLTEIRRAIGTNAEQH